MLLFLVSAADQGAAAALLYVPPRCCGLGRRRACSSALSRAEPAARRNAGPR